MKTVSYTAALLLLIVLTVPRWGLDRSQNRPEEETRPAFIRQQGTLLETEERLFLAKYHGILTRVGLVRVVRTDQGGELYVPFYRD